MKNRSHRYDINRPRPIHGCKHKMYLSMMMVLCIKQHPSNIWSSIHEKVKQHWGWVALRKACISTLRKRYWLNSLIYYKIKREFDIIVACIFRDKETTFGDLFVSWINFETILKNWGTTSICMSHVLFLKLFLGQVSNKYKHKGNKYMVQEQECLIFCSII